MNQNSFLSPELQTDVVIVEPFIDNSIICNNCCPIYTKNDHNIYPNYFKTKYNVTRISSTEVRYNTEINNILDWKYNNFEQYLQAKKMVNISKYNTTL